MSNTEIQTPRRKTNFDYGLRGWLLCLYCMVGFMTIGGAFWAGTAQNTMVAIKAEQIGVDVSAVLAANSAAGLAAIVALLGIGILFGKYRTRIVQTALMIICGVTLVFYGNVNGMVSYVACYFVLEAVGNATSSVGLPQIAAAYFPTKKGSFLGWATIGANLAALVSLGILNAFIISRGVEFATVCFGVFTIAMGLINWFFIPSRPEDANFVPDNGDFTPEELSAHKAMMSGPPIWTIKEAMKNKNFWLLPVAYGLLFMCSNGFLSQMVPYQIEQIRAPIVDAMMATGNFPNMGAAIGAAMSNPELGIAGKAAFYMMILPAFAIPGSILSGWLDQKFGTRRTGMTMAIFYAIAGFAGGLMPYNAVTNWIFVGLFFFWTGANANLVMSHAVSAFGPRDYPRIWGRMAPILNLMRVIAPMVLSVFLAGAVTAAAGYRNAYTFFAFASVLAAILIFFSDQCVFKKPGEAPTGTSKT
jgi:sugar phosphate permease